MWKRIVKWLASWLAREAIEEVGEQLGRKGTSGPSSAERAKMSEQAYKR